MSSEMDEIKRRVTAVEEEQAVIREDARQSQRAAELFAAVDRDVADLRVAFNQQRQVLNAIGQTQAEHTVVLRHQGRAIGALVVEVAAIKDTLGVHTRILAEHTQTLAEQKQTLTGQTRILAEHTQTLAEHTRMLAEQKQLLVQILDRLPPSGG